MSLSASLLLIVMRNFGSVKDILSMARDGVSAGTVVRGVVLLWVEVLRSSLSELDFGSFSKASHDGKGSSNSLHF